MSVSHASIFCNITSCSEGNGEQKCKQVQSKTKVKVSTIVILSIFLSFNVYYLFYSCDGILLRIFSSSVFKPDVFKENNHFRVFSFCCMADSLYSALMMYTVFIISPHSVSKWYYCICCCHEEIINTT